MGSFDTIIVKCPECDAPHEIQTKAGKCELARYRRGVPTIIAAALEGETFECESCGQKCNVTTSLPAFAEVFAYPVRESEEDDGD